MKYLFFAGLIFTFFGCKNLDPKTESIHNAEKFIWNTTTISVYQYMDIISISSGGKTQQFQPKNLPLKSAVCATSASIAYLDALGLSDKIQGITEPNYIYNKKVLKDFNNGNIKQIGTANELNLEKLFTLKPDVVFSTSNPNLNKYHSQLEQQGIPVIYIDEYLEKTPLAKTEIIKLFGILFGKKEEAFNFYEEVKINYEKLKDLTKEKHLKPKIMAGVMYGDIWYSPGGSSFPAQFFKDAGADYIWKNKTEDESLKLSFEDVFQDSDSVDYWMNVADFKNLETLKASNPNYEWFKPVKNQKLYSLSARRNSNGANDYFETGITRPDLVLKDLISIFHPKLIPNHNLYFYHHLK